ncbi:MAG: SGNH/GDSL hydrolase family protein, partial [Thermoanaerobaculia bacterium]|nr:SGNH/GDSL hydrolase family protein [Thermoanaerobaculia bacterium]
MRRPRSLHFCHPRVLFAMGLLTLGFGPVAALATEYVAFGDSITEGTGDDDPIVGYPGRLQGLLRSSGLDDSVRNEGFGGEKTPEGLSRLNSVLDRGGDVLLLMEGSNDISVKISRETTLFNLGQMANRAETKGLEAIHVTMIPRTPRARVDADNLLNQRLIEEIRHLAGLNQRRVVDNFEIFGVQPDWFATLYSQAPTDYVGHPNAAGYDLMASTFFDVLTGVDSTPPVTGILSPWNGANNVKPASEINVELWDFGVGIDITSAVLI